jgi:hypothetical protein
MTAAAKEAVAVIRINKNHTIGVRKTPWFNQEIKEQCQKKGKHTSDRDPLSHLKHLRNTKG